MVADRGRRVVAVSTGTVIDEDAPSSSAPFTSVTHAVRNTVFDPYEALSSVSDRTTFTAPLSRFYQITLETPYEETAVQSGTTTSEPNTYGSSARIFSHVGRLIIDGTIITSPSTVGAVYGAGELSIDYSIISGVLSIPSNSQTTGYGLTKSLIFLESGQTVSFDVTGNYKGLSRANVSRIVGAVAVPANNYGFFNADVAAGTPGSITNITDYSLNTSFSETSTTTVALSAGGFELEIGYYFEVTEVGE